MEVDLRDSNESIVILDYLPVPAMIRRRSGTLDRAPPLRDFTYSGMHKLACNAVTANSVPFVVWEFSFRVLARVRFVTVRAFIC